MHSLSVFVKPTEKEIENLKEEILNNKKTLAEKTLAGTSLLQIAIVHAKVNLAKFLIDNGIDVNQQDEKGHTALHYCSDYNQYEIAGYILKHGGKLNISDKYGNEPLWTATHNCKGFDDRIGIVELFLRFGADKTHANNVNKTPFDIAARYSNLTELFNR